MIAVGSEIGNYRILEEIGLGGMGMVFKGVDTLLSREVAIKMLRPELTKQPALVERFRNEAVVLARLNHPGIALLYNLLQHDDSLIMVMEFVRGETLDVRIKRAGALPYGQALQFFSQILEAIGYAHQNGIIHRDLKPNNIMITPDNSVKVMDFGIARVLGTQRMTQAGSVIGTIEFMAPEQIRGQESSERTDVYALGILLFEMICGRLPFNGTSQYEIMRAHVEMPPLSPRTFVPELPAHVEQAILRALAKEPEERFVSAYEFRAALLRGVHLPSSTLPSGLTGAAVAEGATSITELIEIDQERYFRATEKVTAEVRRRLIDEARKKAEQEAEEERQRLLAEARKQAEQEAAQFAEEERQRLLEEARRRSEQEAARLAEETRRSLIEEARQQAEQEAMQRAVSERLRLVEAARRRAEQEAAQRTAAERQRLVEEARRRAEQEAAHLAAAERQRLIEEARRQAEQEAERLMELETQQLVEEARKHAEQEAARFAETERERLLEAAHKQAEEEAAARATAERKRLFEAARKQAEQEATSRAAVAQQRLFEAARKQAEQEAARIGVEEARRLYEQALQEAEQQASQMGELERQRLLTEARKSAELEAARRASEERKRLFEAARKQAEAEAALLAETERTRLVEEARKQAEAEAAHLAHEERQQLLGEARKKAEKEAARQASKERKRLLTEERKRIRQESAAVTANLPGAQSSRRRLLFLSGGALLAIVVLLAFFYSRTKKTEVGQEDGAAGKPDLVRISGGAFIMGRAYPQQPGEDEAWADLQRPAHKLTVAAFEIDRTEVTNAEYAQFIRKTNRRAPDDWGGNTPPPGQERWPVRNVSYEDAQAFAAWRSQRDGGAAYRLPTEAEWEFAAKGQSDNRYPWGNDPATDRANLEAQSPKPVGSYPNGASPFGVLDLLGNVGELTSSPASVYPGSQYELDQESVGKLVVRGGNFGSSLSGARPSSVTVRGSVAASEKRSTIGFRLVRPIR